ncbi:MAG: acylneuraminate cytidylyltransferase family protein [Dinoroseobacter sp.]|nr:acylneuraminate cytidylyltransferase family protein [Dinoroseobacter sp.]
MIQPSYLAIVPARSGSKRLPGKNLIDFGGKPLIAWSVEAAKSSRYINEVLVSTDSVDIANAAISAGARFEELRKPALATDTVPLIDVVADILQKRGNMPDFVVLLQPTSPLRTGKHIDEAIEVMGDQDAVISVTKLDKPNEWSNTLPPDMSLAGFMAPSVQNRQSQDLSSRYALNGAIYVVRTERLLAERRFMLRNKIVAYEMSADVSVDIDTKLDLLVAKGLYLGLDCAIARLES